MSVEGNSFDDAEFRRGIWRRTATTVAMVTTAHDGRENVMGCEWAMMVATAPLRFVISVGPGHVTHELIERSGEFGLSYCSDQQGRLSHVSGSYSLRDIDKWTLADFPTYPGQAIAAPMIDECPLNVECRVVDTNRLGDHTLFLGEAVWARFDPATSPLIYHDGKYWQLGDQLPKS